MRASGRRRQYELRLAADRTSGEAAPSPEVAALERERRTCLLAAIDALPEHRREVVVYRHLLELSEAETAYVLDTPAGTIKSRLSRALDRLRAELAEPVRDGRESDG